MTNIAGSSISSFRVRSTPNEASSTVEHAMRLFTITIASSSQVGQQNLVTAPAKLSFAVRDDRLRLASVLR